ncbi:hypothetical protein CN378_17635 [Bacillus sp. AFS015802]|uniref:ABC transporter permease n=1 Tax=Bacillus sp. AFS015802 TaxID=2033486 RepID=UPI000BF9AC0F|nr:ABC transporter permease [Bacillus sp. AFS015802]PFA62863.1 hypothetical protein CN378_17635 [Bacillus sp. AFS015802]
MKMGLPTFVKKDFILARRNILIWLIILFPIITAFGASGITDTYSDTPKMVVLKGEQHDLPEEVKVLVADSKEQMKDWVFDLDAKIGLTDGGLVTDGREPKEAIEKAEQMLKGEPVQIGNLSEDLFEKVYAFNLYGAFLFFGIIILFSLVEERKNKTTDLQHVQPVHPVIPILSKVVIASLITVMDFAICSYLLHVPFRLGPVLLIITIGILLGTVLGMAMAFYASTETQALAILKPVTLVFLMSIPGLGFFLGGIMHNVAMADPFYWLLRLIHGLYTNEMNTTYVYLSLILSLVALSLIALNWHRTPYGVKKYHKTSS